MTLSRAYYYISKLALKKEYNERTTKPLIFVAPLIVQFTVKKILGRWPDGCIKL